MGSSRHREARQAEVTRNDRALLEAARRVFARDGRHATVAAIADEAGVGVGSLYRRYSSKDDLFRALLNHSNEQWANAAERALADPDPWQGLAGFIIECVEFGQGTLAPLADEIDGAPEPDETSQRADTAFQDMIQRAHQAGVLRPDATAVDIILLIEQLGRSPLLEQLRLQGRTGLLADAQDARRRIIAVALDGLHRAPQTALPGEPPSSDLVEARWAGRPEQCSSRRRS
ncbi:TetR/AcrR family transcriptional regulator [Nonomuraea sp. NPDC049480]|uniref:TetR/AcrR family transcriptional regulator n=1 Tax=Nonomuraea sp. NPDC049480 TaxID=3364353 RepID=UPI00378B5D65